ncbi:MAG: polyamine aminopropyltransferase [Chitinivibrionales bacterium]|nr:polyamine aminopropyltransferase [Chitinivibrionales bacterium]
MSTEMNYQQSEGTSIWLENLVDGTAGLRIKTRQAVSCSASPFQKIEVFDTYAFGRILVLGGVIVLTEKDEGIYHEMITHPAMLMHSSPENVCIIGGGDGGCLREVLKHDCVKKATVVEIDEQVKETVAQYFPGLAEGFSDARTEIIVRDGFDYLNNSDEKYDIIIVDSYDPGGPVQSLETASFFAVAAERLNKKGVAVFQTDSPVRRGDFFRQAARNIASYFTVSQPYLCMAPSFPGGICSFVIGAGDNVAVSGFNRERYNALAGTCCYYNEKVHSGAFLLPENIAKLLEL